MTKNLTPTDNSLRLSSALIADLQSIISGGQAQAFAAVNSALTLTYWHVGKRINEDVLQGVRASYGKQVVASVAERLVVQYGKSFEARNLRRMMQFAELFPDAQIVTPLVSQLSWTHVTILEAKLHTALIAIKERLAEQKQIEQS